MNLFFSHMHLEQRFEEDRETSRSRPSLDWKSRGTPLSPFSQSRYVFDSRVYRNNRSRTIIGYYSQLTAVIDRYGTRARLSATELFRLEQLGLRRRNRNRGLENQYGG